MGKKKKSAGGNPASVTAHYDADTVRSYAHGQWAAILSCLGGVSSSLLDSQHHGCPKCRGTDRFRFADRDGDGSIICNQCCRTEGGNGFLALAWLTGKKFYDCVVMVAEHLGVPPSNDRAGFKQNGSHHNKHSNADPAEKLTFHDWDDNYDLLAAYWCLTKPPITLAAIKLCGGRPARYRNQFTVIAFPVHGENFDHPDAKPVGWTLYNITGDCLPSYSRDKTDEHGQWKVEWQKVLTTFGSKPGLLGPITRTTDATTIWKLEGPSDLLAFYSLADIPPAVAAVTNNHGAGEKPSRWMLDIFADNRAIVLHDADQPGQAGALYSVDKQGNEHPGWAPLIASTATECRNARLPYDIAETHGKDLRDFAGEGFTAEHPRSYNDLAELEAAAEIVAAAELPDSPSSATPLEEDDDPHRLARVNLERYAAQADGATIRYWREEYYTWKPSRGCYRTIKEKEFQAKLTAAIKAEFDRQWVEDMARYEEKTKQADYDWDNDKGPPKARKVTKHLVSNVLAATGSLTCLPASVELMTWLNTHDPNGSPSADRRPYIAMKNGIIDLENLIADADESKCIVPLSPDWFSTVRLPYEFNPDATCPKWEAFLEKNLELDPERIKRVQEWAGYCLTTDTGHAKFLALEGEGSNGKSVFCAGLTAMLGAENCSHLGLESFGPDFDKADMIGKLVNICADVGEVDKLAEGHLKSFTSGDVVHFKRKHISGISCIPTARLIISFNNRPRFADRSFGIWRRMLLVPWLVEIKDHEKVPNMDKAWWWERQGELPGMLNWALVGLGRLRQQGRFTESVVGNSALEDYRDESNPAREFLKEHFRPSESSIRCSLVYHFYCKWCLATGHKPFGDRVFGREVKRVFKDCERKRVRHGEMLHWNYAGVAFQQDEICGQKVSDENLF